jgi:nitrous oxide reductase accessory protein NosL
MLKIVSAIMILLFLVGCSNEVGMKVPSTMFQSVNDNQATLVQDAKDKRYCTRCGMDLVKFYKTSHTAQYKGKKYQYCSMHCLEDHLGEGITLKNLKVVDVASLKLISVKDVFYVVGSKKRGTMSRVSKYAFASKDDAKKFQAKFGGDIMNFNDALDVAKKDFK